MNKYLSPALVIYSQSQVHRFSWSFTLVDDNDSIFDIQERYITLTGFTVINFEKTGKAHLRNSFGVFVQKKWRW